METKLLSYRSKQKHIDRIVSSQSPQRAIYGGTIHGDQKETCNFGSQADLEMGSNEDAKSKGHLNAAESYQLIQKLHRQNKDI